MSYPFRPTIKEVYLRRDSQIHPPCAEKFAEHAGQSVPRAELLIRVAQTQRKLTDGDKLLATVEKQTPLGEIEYEHPGSPTQPARQVIQTLRAAELELKPRAAATKHCRQ